MSILVAQLGARRHYAVPRALHQCGFLDRLVTDISAKQPFWRWLDNALPRRMRPQVLASLLGRQAPGVPASRITSLLFFALSPAQQRQRGEAHAEYWARRNRVFCRHVTRHGFGEARAVYAFNGAALEIFEAAKERGLTTILDQTSAPWRWYGAMIRNEAARWPGWEDDSSNILATDALCKREEREWQLADRIICGSRFVAEALAHAGIARDRCVVIPYAGHAIAPRREHEVASAARAETKVLFAGTLQLGKGVQYLMEAARLLKGESIHIRLAGPSLLADNAIRQLGAVTELVGRVSRADMAKHYAWADVFVLPTLSEGSANVVYEAMAAGLTVVTTPNAGSIIQNNHDGLIVPPRDPAALAEAIRRLAGDRERRRTLGREAQASIAQNSFDLYARRLGAVYDDASEPPRALCA